MTKFKTLKALAIATVAALAGLGAAPNSSSAMNLAAPAVETNAASGTVEQVGFRGRRGGFRRGGFRRGGFRRFHRGFRRYRFRRYGHHYGRRWARRNNCLRLQARGYRIRCH